MLTLAIKFFLLFRICFWLSSHHEPGLLSLVAVRRLLIVVAPLVAEHRLGHTGFSSCKMWAQQLQLMDSIAWAQ